MRVSSHTRMRMVLTHLTVSFIRQHQNVADVTERDVAGVMGSPSFILKSKPTASESTHSNMKAIFSPIWCNFSSYGLQVECLCYLLDIGLRFALKASILS